MVLIEYPKCFTCKNAEKWLKENGIPFEVRNIVTDTPSVAELKVWMKQSGKEIKKWFNTSGLKYKELNLKDKLVAMTDEEKVELLASDGMLIKRPILVGKDFVWIGFKVEDWAQLLK